MWHPKQLLHEKVIDALLLGSFTPLQIEFLGWLSYNASALNNSRNPVKAAHTILSKASDPDERMHKMLLTFSNRKMESIQPETVEPHAEADKILDNLAEDIDTALIKAHMRGGKMEDFTKGGVSDGEDSITSDLPGEEKVQ